MYGIINIAFEDLVKENYGENKWLDVKKRSGMKEDYFLSNVPYADSVTYNMAHAVSEELDIPLRSVLITFGEWWVMRTAHDKYGGLMKMGGNDLREFLINLPMFHNRVMLIYPKLTPPEFKITDLKERSLHLHYYSARPGLTDFVVGLVQGLGKLYETPVQIQHLQSKEALADHDIFKVSW